MKTKIVNLICKEICKIFDIPIEIFLDDSADKKRCVNLQDIANVLGKNLKFHDTDKKKKQEKKHYHSKTKFNNTLYLEKKDDIIYFVKNPTIRLSTPVNKDKKIVYQTENKKYYDYETCDEINIEGLNVYTIKIKKSEDISEHKKSMSKIKEIFKNHEIDELIVDGYIDPANIMMKLCESALNIYRDGENFVRNGESIENEFLENASRGPLYYCKKGKYNGEYTRYDKNGFYLELFQTIKFPVGKPSETTEYKKGDTGIYKCVVDLPKYYSDDMEYFTNYDLDLFEKMKIEYKIVSGLVYKYTIDCAEIKTWNVFDDLYENRTQTIKSMYQSFWGKISGKDYSYFTFDELNEQKEDTWEVVKFEASDNKYKVLKNKYKYKNMLFRLGIFMNSYSRYEIGKIAYKLEKKGYEVLRIHTDSIITNAPKEKIDIGTKLGQFKIEKCYKELEIESFVKIHEYIDNVKVEKETKPKIKIIRNNNMKYFKKPKTT
jgi:hypothetical protein